MCLWRLSSGTCSTNPLYKTLSQTSVPPDFSKSNKYGKNFTYCPLGPSIKMKSYCPVNSGTICLASPKNKLTLSLTPASAKFCFAIRALFSSISMVLSLADGQAVSMIIPLYPIAVPISKMLCGAAFCTVSNNNCLVSSNMTGM